MTSPRLLALTMLAVAGCDDGDCIDGVCADLDQTVTFPGPCRSAGSDGGEHSVQRTYTYDDAGRIVRIDRAGFFDDVVDHEYTVVRQIDTTRWEYDGLGDLAGIISEVNPAPGWAGTAFRGVWLFGATTVVGYGATYDRALFAFVPPIGAALEYPRAELGLIKDGAGTYTWDTTDPHHWIRHEAGEAARDVVYDLDDRGRLLRRGDETWVFDGDLLLSAPGHTYRYDRGANVVEDTDGRSREIFSYDCW